MDFVSWHIGDWLAGTSELDHLVEFTYFRLCLHYYEFDGILKDDDRANALRCKVGLCTYRKHKARLIEACKIEVFEGYIRQAKCDRVLKKVEKNSKIQRKKAHKRWDKYKNNSINSTNSMSDDMPMDMPRHMPTSKLVNRKKEEDENPSTDYRFEGQVIRLNHNDFERWDLAFTQLDLVATLTSYDAYLMSLPEKDRKTWFPRTAKYLENQDNKVKTQRQRPQMLPAI